MYKYLMVFLSAFLLVACSSYENKPGNAETAKQNTPAKQGGYSSYGY